MSTPKLIGTGRKVASRIIQPGEKGYHDIDEAVREGRHIRRVTSFDHKWDRANGKVVGGLTLGAVATPMLPVVPFNRGARKRTEAAQAKTKALRATIGKGATVHNITTMAPKAGLLNRIGRLSPEKATALVATGYGVGVGGLLASTHGPRKRLTQAERELRSTRRAAKKASVGKSFNGRLALHNVTHPKELARVVRENPWEAGIAGGGAAAGGAAGSRNRKSRKGTAAAAATGAAAGQAGYYAAGFGAIRRADRLKQQGQRQGYRGLSRSQQEKVWRDHRKSHGVSQGKPMTVHQQHAVFSNYPKQLPGAKEQRFAAALQRGKYGRAFNAAATVGGAMTVGGAYAAGARAHGRKQTVHKSLYSREDRLSILRTGQAAAGLGLLAWGAGRSRFLGASLARGIKAASGRGNTQAADALRLALAAQGSLRRGTAPGEARLRQIRRVNTAINRVPGPIRPEVAGVAGLLLAGNATPLRRTTYRQVSTPVRVVGGGW